MDTRAASGYRCVDRRRPVPRAQSPIEFLDDSPALLALRRSLIPKLAVDDSVAIVFADDACAAMIGHTRHELASMRSGSLLYPVKNVQSKSAGTVAEAALSSGPDNQMQVLVAVSVKTTIAAATEHKPRRWRMRLSVEKAGDSAKVSNVEFVP